MSGIGGSWIDHEAKLKIAESIKEHLAAKGMTRRCLIRHDLGENTVNKALAGDFSRMTLVKLEAILNRSFHDGEETANGDAKQVYGGYSKRSIEGLIGSYLFLRPAFSNPTNINAYKLDMEWNHEKGGLSFQESGRADDKFVQNGMVHIPPSKPFLYLSTLAAGSVRNIVLNSFDPDGIARGIISTVYNIKAALYTPVSAPVVIMRKEQVESMSLGIIEPSHDLYDSYEDLLSSVVASEYSLILQGPSKATNRRKSLSIAI